jgi:hypothetical protein
MNSSVLGHADGGVLLGSRPFLLVQTGLETPDEHTSDGEAHQSCESAKPQNIMWGAAASTNIALLPSGSVRFRANRVKTVFSSMHNPPFLLATRGGDGFTSHPKKPVWREI